MIAHHLADLQDRPDAELDWDLHALQAAESIHASEVDEEGMPISVRGMLPSLHLNVADAARRCGDLGRARTHLALGREACDALADDGYGRMILGGLDRLERRLVDRPKGC